MPFDHSRRPRGRFFIFPFIAIAIALIIGGLVMLLWNAIMPGLVKVGRISYWQSVGLLVLCRLLFGSLRPGQYRGRGSKGGPWREKWIRMTPEERQQFREEWKKRCASKKNNENNDLK